MARLREELLALETATFEICDIVDTGTDLAAIADAVVIGDEAALAVCSSSCSCSSCCSCSTSSCCSSSTSTGCGG